MFRSTPVLGLAALLFGAGAGVGALTSTIGESPPEQLTTDTLAYCRQLEARLDQLRGSSNNAPQAVGDLARAGKRMCDQGLTRGGILRLRSAIVLMLHQPSGDALPVGRTD